MTTAQTPRTSPLDRALLAIEKMEAKLADSERARSEPIAVVGMGCRFPGGGTGPDGYWQMLLDGVDAVVEIPASRWPADATADDPAAVHPGTRWAGLLDDVAGFDADFFGMSPREVMSLDPQHRLLLEVAWEALEDAGIPTTGLLGSRTGVYIGATTQDYQTQITSAGLDHLDAYTAIGNGLCFAAGRLSHVLGLQGPSMTIDTACSSSLVATHLAVASLRARESDLALAGGVSLILSPLMMAMMAKTHALSPDGRCKTFDARANGIARGEGCGVLVLKRLGDAVRDRDRVWAVIRGSAVNQDGRSTGLTTPNVLAQQALLRQALANARVAASRVGYVEAHGTGTSLGDPIEVEALKAVLGQPRADGMPCGLGSVKTNLGHLEAAAGVAGLIKVVLALKHGQIPRNLHFEALNPRISFDGTPFVVPTSTQPFPTTGGPRVAGLSAFGLSGTNTHVVLEEAPALAASPAEPPVGRVELLLLSARDPAALTELAGSWRERVAEDPERSLYDLAWASGVHRAHLGHRMAVAARARDELLGALDSAAAGQAAPGLTQGEALSDGRPRVVFVFPGQGSQWVGMGLQLYAGEPVFRDALQRCDAAVARHTGWSLLAELGADADHSRLSEIDVVQPLLFAVSVALAALWRSWGVEPDAVVGHSMGEITAAHVAGALSLDDAAAIVCRRSHLLKRAVGLGAMAIVELSLDEAAAAIAPYAGRVAVGGSNSPRTTILSGEFGALEELAQVFSVQEVFFRVVRGTVPSHSPKVAFLGDDLVRELRGITPCAGQVPIYSTVTGEVTDGAGYDARYWLRNLLEPVRFAQSVQQLVEDGHQLFIEVSANPVLLGPLQQTLANLPTRTRVQGSLRRDQDEPLTMIEALGSVYTAGLPVDQRLRMPVPGRHVSLPTYPWQRTRHWIDRSSSSRRADRPRRDPSAHPLLTSSFHPAVHGGDHFWETEIALADLPWLRDHAVQEAALMPATGYVEMAQAAAARVWGPGAHQVESVELRQVLSLREGEVRRVQLVLTEDGPGRLGFQIVSRVDAEGGAEAAEWVRHARGAIRSASMLEDPSGASIQLDEIRARCPEALTADAHYENMAAMALRYGPTFQGVLQVWRRAGEALGKLALPASLASEANRYGIHPALLDALLQLLAASFTGEASLPANSAYLPVRLGSVRLFRRPEGELWGHARLSTWPGPDVNHPGGDVALYDATGALVLEARGLVVQRIDSLERSADPDASLLYELRWEPAPALPASATTPQGTWLVLTDGVLGEALAQRLTEGGATVVRACHDGASVPGARRVDPSVPNPFRPLLQEIVARGEALQGVVHLWSVGATLADDAAPEDLLALQSTGYGAALSLAQELSWMGLREAPRLFLVTRGAVPADLDARGLALAQAPLAGLGAVIAHELPELKVTLLDLDPGAPTSELEDLVAHLGAGDAEDQVALRAGGRRVARLVHAPSPHEAAARFTLAPAAEQPFRLTITNPGVLDDLALTAVDRRAPGPGEVEVAVEATGLNFRDVLQALGVIPDDLLAQESHQVRLGGECAGRVAALGEGVTGLAVGQRVLAVALASFSSYVIAPAEMVVPLPDELTPVEAAAIPVVFFTAYYSLAHVARLAKGERVLIHAATGGVGLAALQWARHVGAEVYATAGSPEKRAFLESLGVEHVSDSRSTRFVDDVMRWTRGEGVDVVLNCLGGELLSRSLDLLREHGRFVEIGVKDYFNNAPLGLRPFLRNLSLTLVNLRSFVILRPDRGRALLLEVLERFREGVFRPLPVHLLPISRAAEAFRFMAQARHMGKIVLDMQDPEARVRRPLAQVRPVDPAGTWVISGGLTGVGLATVGWLVDSGVRAIALLGRRAPSPDAAAKIDAWRVAGVQIHVASVDVSNRPALRAALDVIRAALGPIRGIVHSAMVLKDGGLLAQTYRQFEEVFAPKALGAWNLHALTQGDPVDHFVLYSSAASLLGSPGQANYCAANALVDALAFHRQAHGKAALVINWGPFAEIGLAAAQANRGERIAAQGMDSLSLDQAGACFRRLLGEPRTQVGVMSLDVRRWRQSYPRAASGPLLSQLAKGDGLAASAHPFLQLLRAASSTKDEVRASLVEHLTATLAQVLRIDPGRIEPTTRMGTLGLDSLMAIELRNRLEASTGLTLSVTMMWNYPTVQLLSDHLLEKLGLSADASLTAAPPAPPEASALEKSLETVADDELLDLFDDQLAALENLV